MPISRPYVALISSAVSLAAGTPVFAQARGATTSVTDAAAQGTPPAGASAEDTTGTPGAMNTPVAPGGMTPAQREQALLAYMGQEYSVGWRVWAFAIPTFLVDPFVHIEPGWSGGVEIATGPEFVYRNRNLDIVLSAMYVSYGAAPGYFHGVNEGPNATERIESRLFGVYATAHFLWGIRFHRMFQLQIGPGLGIGFIGGNLYRTQATMSGGVWQECSAPGAGPECGTENNHYPGQPTPVGDPGNGGRYHEPNWFGGGSVPAVLPWISLPHIAFHVRPHRHFDFKVEGGFAIIGFYGGASLHYVF
jgi:hypothetical protein